MTDTPNETSLQQPKKPSLARILIPIVAIVTIVLAVLALVKQQDDGSMPSGGSTSSMQVGAQLPDFELTQFPQRKLKLSELKSKVTMINFWATWCAACIEEMPSILKLREAYKGKGFELVAVNMDENPDEILASATKKLGIDFPVYLDKDQKLADHFNINAIPLTVLLDKDRKILLVHGGDRDWSASDIRSKMEKWLSE